MPELGQALRVGRGVRVPELLASGLEVGGQFVVWQRFPVRAPRAELCPFLVAPQPCIQRGINLLLALRLCHGLVGEAGNRRPGDRPWGWCVQPGQTFVDPRQDILAELGQPLRVHTLDGVPQLLTSGLEVRGQLVVGQGGPVLALGL